VNKRIAAVALLGSLLVSATNVPAVAGSDGIETVGNILTYALPTVTVGAVAGHEDAEGAWQLGKSYGLTVGTTLVLKVSIDETRPNGGHYSFPSGHTSSSFSCAEFLRERYGWRYGLPAYLAATFVGYSRVESNNHYTHDVVAGAAIGIASSYLFTTPYQSWHIALSADHAALGVSFSRSW